MGGRHSSATHREQPRWQYTHSICLLLRYRLHIIGEVSVEVNHCLMALPGVQKSDIRRVQSHPQALAQVDNYLRNSLPRATKEAVDDTAGAAQAIAKHGWR